ncbi:flagellar hook-length control protein FliK [Variovorax sp. YR752]|uniref:flagellar hook-length control protein FliK n=1 Tax=Variovorax sp. YR752 TaxID=1884383 RepID=UPI00313797F1
MQVQTASNTLPPARPQPAESAASGDAFAQLLARQPEVEPEGESESTNDTASNPGAGARPDEARAAKARQGGARTPAPKTTQAEGGTRGARDGSRDGVEAKDGSSEDERPADAPAPAIDPALAQWLTQLHRPQAEAGTAGATPLLPGHAPAQGAGKAIDASADAAIDDAAGAALQAADSRVGSGARAAAQRHGESAERAALARVDEAAARGAQDEAGPAATTARAASEPGFVLPAGPEPAAAAAAANAPTGSAAAASAEAPVSAAVPVPMESPEFAEAFGVQVSVLARDGVQEAELHLNPAEMGPVSVQIVLDGERARIDFGAQAAATRAAIEASLPELAAALRDAGLTLAGGGVSQHTSGRGDGAHQGAPDSRGDARPGAPAADTAPARPHWRGRVSAGGVDLYA